LAAKPNFFSVGTPKCGTTALHQCLRPHPNVFMPRVKEPDFLATDLGTCRRSSRWKNTTVGSRTPPRHTCWGRGIGLLSQVIRGAKKQWPISRWRGGCRSGVGRVGPAHDRAPARDGRGLDRSGTLAGARSALTPRPREPSGRGEKGHSRSEPDRRVGSRPGCAAAPRSALPATARWHS